MRPFRDFMESALYDPEQGYYNRRVPTEDFYTAPELHPAFAAVLAGEIGQRLSQLRDSGVSAPYSIVEMGSGNGKLAREIVRNLKPIEAELGPLRYVLVERSQRLLLDSAVSLTEACPPVLGYSRLDEMLPCSGVFLSNELVDAFPVHLLEKREGKVREVYVDDSGETALGKLSRPGLDAFSAGLAEGERRAANLEAGEWLRCVSEKLTAGFVVTVDYGKRFGGTPNAPRTFFRHALGSDATLRKGMQDITASVDFELLMKEGRKLGLLTERYSSLSRFLIDGGILEMLPRGEGPEAFKERAKIKTLFHPEGMGEAFKVLIQRKSVGARSV